MVNKLHGVDCGAVVQNYSLDIHVTELSFNNNNDNNNNNNNNNNRVILPIIKLNYQIILNPKVDYQPQDR